MAESVRISHPPFLEAVLADARIAAAYRGERREFRSRLDGLLQAIRLALVTDAFLGQMAYRAKARMRTRRVPILPWLAHRVAMMTAQISIGDAAVLQPGVFIPHGQIVVQGTSVIHAGAILYPFITVGPVPPHVIGPRIGPRASVGTGARVLGELEVGHDARVGTNAVVLTDVPADTTVVGSPAKAVSA